FRERHASWAQESRGLAGCLPGASRVLGEGAAQACRMLPGAPRVPVAEAARAHLVPSGSATRPGCGCRPGSPGAFRERHASRLREPRGLTVCLPGAPRVLLPRRPGRPLGRALFAQSAQGIRPSGLLFLLKAALGLLLGRWT